MCRGEQGVQARNQQKCGAATATAENSEKATTKAAEKKKAVASELTPQYSLGREAAKGATVSTMTIGMPLGMTVERRTAME